MQQRGGGEWERSLVVSGEEICAFRKRAISEGFFSWKKGCGGACNLIRRITDANIEIRQFHLAHIPQQHLQPLRFRFPLHPFRHFGGHARVQLHRDDLLRFFQDLDRQVACARADFQHDVTLFEIGFVDDGLSYAGVFEHVLADVGFHFEDGVGGGAVGGAVGGAIALGLLCFWHFQADKTIAMILWRLAELLKMNTARVSQEVGDAQALLKRDICDIKFLSIRRFMPRPRMPFRKNILVILVHPPHE